MGTGWYRDGTCKTGPNDRGTHVVCAQMTQEFLDYTKSMGNDLSTPRSWGFPGLRPGDQWCLCALRCSAGHSQEGAAIQWNRQKQNGSLQSLQLASNCAGIQRQNLLQYLEINSVATNKRQ